MSSSSLFEQYAYRRKVNVLSNDYEKENKPGLDGETHTPNKAHPQGVTRILETPDSLLHTATLETGEVLLSSGRRRKERRRRKARIVSSSEDEPVQASAAQLVKTPAKTSSVFSGLPQSKRSKISTTETQEKPSFESRQSQGASSQTLNFDPRNGSCVKNGIHIPRRLFEERGVDKERGIHKEGGVGRLKLCNWSDSSDDDLKDQWSHAVPVLSAKSKGHKNGLLW